MEPHAESPPTSRTPLLACALLVLAVVAAFANGYHGAFVFDDKSAILTNESLRQANWFLAAIHPPHATGITVDGRPILNLTLALNWLVGEAQPEGYHLVNIAIHALATLTLYGIVRRLFAKLALPWADVAALAACLLWALHPLNTESVTYLIQRAESLMGLFYLLTLYCFLRSLEGEQGLMWRNLSVLACLLGIGTKEVAVSAPLIVLLYDRTFVSGTLREAWRHRRYYYLGLFSTWLVLGFLVASTHSRGETSGPQSTATFTEYIESQPMALLTYLKLSVWPAGLNFDRGMVGYGELSTAMRDFPWVALGVGVSLYGLWKNTAWGLGGFFFFCILAPTTFMPGARQTIAEHRMYLALIPIVLGVTVAGVRMGGRWAVVPLVAVAGILGYLTSVRNHAYANEMILYQDSVAKDPTNHFALGNLGAQYMDADQLEEARTYFEAATRADPKDPLPWDDLGAIEIKEGHREAAIADYRQTLRIIPTYYQGHLNLGNALLVSNEPMAAREEYEAALKSHPGDPLAENGIAITYEKLGAPLEAVEHFKKSIEGDPGNADTWGNLGNALTAAKKPMDAVAVYQKALTLRPSYFEARYNLGTLLFEQNYTAQAVVELQQAIRVRPGSIAAHDNLGNALMKLNRFEAAATAYEETLTLDPKRAYTHYNLASAYFQLGRTDAAKAECRQALALRPGMKPALDLLARLTEPAPKGS